MDDMFAAALRGIGSVSGATLALIYQPPKTVPEFWTRASFSIGSGFIFGPPFREWVGWVERMEMRVAAAALVAALSWWAMAMAVRLFGAWKGPK